LEGCDAAHCWGCRGSLLEGYEGSSTLGIVEKLIGLGCDLAHWLGCGVALLEGCGVAHWLGYCVLQGRFGPHPKQQR